MNKISHIEIAGVDGARLEEFYSRLLGWEITRGEAGGFRYGRIDTGESYSAGIRHEPEGRAEIVLYVQVEDVTAAVARATALGATVRIPPMSSDGLCFALIADPEGNPIGLTQPRDADAS